MENKKNYKFVPYKGDREINKYWQDIKNNFDENNSMISSFIKS